MKTKRYSIFQLLIAGVLLSATLQQHAIAAFSSGSDGSYGAINVPNSQTVTLQVPSNGVFNCTTITVGSCATLNFTPNALNTPVYLLATGDVNINGGAIIVDGAAANNGLGGAGGPGGFSGGMAGITGGHNLGGDGAGPGGGKTTNGWYGGVYGFSFRSNTNAYGNALLYPLVGGSGGAGENNNGYGGGGGGGAILIASNTKITIINTCTAGIYARGGYGSCNGGSGSGGAIRLVAPIVSGVGNIDVSGGSDCGSRGGSQGRIRIDCTDDFAYRSLNLVGSFSRGSQMFVFQTNTVQLDITSAAGQSIPVGTTNSVTVSLALGSPTNQIVTLQASNLTSNQPVRIAVVPDTGPSAFFDGVVTNTGNPSLSSFGVIIPVGTVSKINAWTR